MSERTHACTAPLSFSFCFLLPCLVGRQHRACLPPPAKSSTKGRAGTAEQTCTQETGKQRTDKQTSRQTNSQPDKRRNKQLATQTDKQRTTDTEAGGQTYRHTKTRKHTHTKKIEITKTPPSWQPFWPPHTKQNSKDVKLPFSPAEYLAGLFRCQFSFLNSAPPVKKNKDVVQGTRMADVSPD